MLIFDRVVDTMSTNKILREQGRDINIPLPFPRMSRYLPGIQKGRYYNVTANSKVGKSQIADFLFMYNPFKFISTNKTNIKLKIFYFTMEMNKEEKVKQAISHFLNQQDRKLIISPERMDSQFQDYILENSVLDKVKGLKELFTKFESCVEFIDDIKNPYGIYSHIRNYAEANGTYVTKKLEFEMVTDEGEKIKEVKDVVDYYVPNDPDEYVIILIDHASLITPETVNGHRQTLHEAIFTLSSNYLVRMRNRWNYIPVLIQQQAAATESVENMKLNRLQPSADGLGDCKLTGRDVDVMLGLFAPVRHKITEYEKYDLRVLRDRHRELSVILNRRGGSISTQLYFNGAINHFEELPPISSPELVELYAKLSR